MQASTTGSAPDPAAGRIRGRLLGLEVACPSCRSRPALRITAELAEALRQAPPHQRIATYQCQRRGCGTIYDLTAAACQGAG